MTEEEQKQNNIAEDDFDILDVVAARLSLAERDQAGSSGPNIDQKEEDGVNGKAKAKNLTLQNDVASREKTRETKLKKTDNLPDPKDEMKQARDHKTSYPKVRSVHHQTGPVTEVERVAFSNTIPGAFACSVPCFLNDREDEAASLANSHSTAMESPMTSTESCNLDLSTTNEGLAHATPVSEQPTSRPVLPQADAVDLEAQQNKDAEGSSGDKRWLLLAGGVVLLVVLVLVVGVSLGVTQTDRESPPAFISPPNTSASPSEPVELVSSAADRIRSLLWNETLQAIKEDPFSPQSLAFDFVKKDIHLDTYPDWRIQQRFAIATFYYSTSGGSWKFNTGWVSLRVHECQWYACPTLPLNINATQEGLMPFHALGKYNNPCNNVDPAVVEQEHYEKLWAWSHDLEGSIPPEVGLLTNVRSIALGYNGNITGTIPSQLGLLSDLELLDLCETNVSGTLPKELGHLSSLKSLHLKDTPLTGLVPLQLANLSTLVLNGTDLVLP